MHSILFQFGNPAKIRKRHFYKNFTKFRKFCFHRLISFKLTLKDCFMEWQCMFWWVREKSEWKLTKHFSLPPFLEAFAIRANYTCFFGLTVFRQINEGIQGWDSPSSTITVVYIVSCRGVAHLGGLVPVLWQ